MLSLVGLPAEVILLIMRHLGSGYLRAQADRLLVCKAWLVVSQDIKESNLKALSRYNIAQPMAFEDLELTSENLQRFLVASNRAHSLRRTRSLSIDGTYLTNSYPYDITTAIAIVNEISAEEAQQDGQELSPGGRRIVRIYNDYQNLFSFALHLPQMAKLKSFQLNTFTEWGMPKRLEDIRRNSIVSLISLLPESLTSLTIDDSSLPSRFRPDPNEFYHLCPLLLSRGFLPNLRHLRIRTQTICPKLFELESRAQHSQLETMVLYLTMDAININSAYNIPICTDFECRAGAFYSQMMNAAKASIVRLPFIRALRILTHQLPEFFGIASFDVISGRMVKLPEGVCWDDVDWIDEGVSDHDTDEELDIELSDNSPPGSVASDIEAS